MIHVGQANHTGNMNDTIPAMGTQPYCFMSKYTKQIKEAVSIPVSSVGRIVTPENAEALIENGLSPYLYLKTLNYSEKDKPLVYANEYFNTEIIKFNLIRQKNIQY